jgi:hypothetical protein
MLYLEWLGSSMLGSRAIQDMTGEAFRAEARHRLFAYRNGDLGALKGLDETLWLAPGSNRDDQELAMRVLTYRSAGLELVDAYLIDPSEISPGALSRDELLRCRELQQGDMCLVWFSLALASLQPRVLSECDPPILEWSSLVKDAEPEAGWALKALVPRCREFVEHLATSS